MCHVKFFRFNEYEDVFIDGDRIIYACAEPYQYAETLASHEYKGIISEFEIFNPKQSNNVEEVREWIISDTFGCGIEYLENLEYAHPLIAAAIINSDTKRLANYLIDNKRERELYVEYKTKEVNDRAQELLND